MIDLGDVVSLAVDIVDTSGNAADAGAITVTITKPNGDSDALTPARQSQGRYVISYTPTLVGLHLVKWVATGENASAFTDSFTVANPSALLSLDEARRFLNITSRGDDDELREFVQVATSAASEYCRVAFEFTTHNEQHDVAHGQSGVILRHPRAINVISVQMKGETLDPGEYRLNSTGEILQRIAGYGLVPFSSGLGAVTVEYTSGLSAQLLPTARHAAREMLRHLWQTQRGTKGSNLPLAEGWESGKGYTFPNRIVELLEPIRRIA